MIYTNLDWLELKTTLSFSKVFNLYLSLFESQCFSFVVVPTTDVELARLQFVRTMQNCCEIDQWFLYIREMFCNTFIFLSLTILEHCFLFQVLGVLLKLFSIHIGLLNYSDHLWHIRMDLYICSSFMSTIEFIRVNVIKTICLVR